MVWLFLDTSQRDRIRFGALTAGNPRVRTFRGRAGGLLRLLPHSTVPQNLRRLTGICVVRGPGAFSSVRAGVLVANLLSRFARLPLVGIDLEDSRDLHALAKSLARREIAPSDVILPTYVAPPNITCPHA